MPLVCLLETVPITATACNSLPRTRRWLVSLPSFKASLPHGDLPFSPFCQTLSNLPASLVNHIPCNQAQDCIATGLFASCSPIPGASFSASQNPQELILEKGTADPDLVQTEEEKYQGVVVFPCKVGVSVHLNKML